MSNHKIREAEIIETVTKQNMELIVIVNALIAELLRVDPENEMVKKFKEPEKKIVPGLITV